MTDGNGSPMPDDGGFAGIAAPRVGEQAPDPIAVALDATCRAPVTLRHSTKFVVAGT